MSGGAGRPLALHPTAGARRGRARGALPAWRRPARGAAGGWAAGGAPWRRARGGAEAPALFPPQRWRRRRPPAGSGRRGGPGTGRRPGSEGKVPSGRGAVHLLKLGRRWNVKHAGHPHRDSGAMAGERGRGGVGGVVRLSRRVRGRGGRWAAWAALGGVSALAGARGGGEGRGWVLPAGFDFTLVWGERLSSGLGR